MVRVSPQMGLYRGSVLLRVPHAGTLQEGKLDFGCGKFLGKEDAGDLTGVDGGSFQRGLTKIDAAKIGLPEVAVAEIQSRGIQAAEIQSSQIAALQVALVACGLLDVELLNAAFAEQFVHRIV